MLIMLNKLDILNEFNFINLNDLYSFYRRLVKQSTLTSFTCRVKDEEIEAEMKNCPLNTGQLTTLVTCKHLNKKFRLFATIRFLLTDKYSLYKFQVQIDLFGIDELERTSVFYFLCISKKLYKSCYGTSYN